MKKIIIAFIALCLSSAGICQTIVRDRISVNNLVIGNTYTQGQLELALGMPTRIDPPNDKDEYKNAYTFHYGEDDRFNLFDGVLYGFDLWTPTYSLNNLIRVGDNISKIDQLGGIKEVRRSPGVQLIDWAPSRTGLYAFTSVCFYYNENNIITMITAFINDL